jgi:hypothetical protein
MGIFAGTNNFRGYKYGIELPDGFLPVAIRTWGCWFSSLFLSRAFVFLFPFFSTRVRILGLENYVGDFLKLDRERRPFPPVPSVVLI